MRSIRYGLLIAVASFLTVVSSYAIGLTLAVTPNRQSGNGGIGYDPNPYMIGWEFSVSATTHIKGLAYFDYLGDGLVDSHQVGIFDATSGALLVSATVDAGLSPLLIDGFRVVSVEFTLHPGTYVIGGQSLSNHDFDIVIPSSISSIAGISYVEERELLTSAFVLPSVSELINAGGIFGPDFVVGPVPEPGMLALLGIGLAGIAFARRKQ